MRAFATLLLPDGKLHQVAAGDIVGRLPSAALFLDDERVSEAHALVSLRGRELKLLSLRGRLIVDGRVCTETVLEEGMVIEPAPGLELSVAEVRLPETVLSLQAPGLPRQILSGTTSLVVQPRPAVIERYVGDALAWVWPVGEGWRLRVGQGAAEPLTPGETFTLQGVPFTAVAEPLSSAGRDDTRGAPTDPPALTIVARYDVVHVFAEGVEVHFDGLLARILSELASIAAPVEWEGVAAEIWPKEEDRHALRSRWDVSLSRIRRRLRTAGLRDDLVRAAGIGLVELFLRPGDRIDEQT